MLALNIPSRNARWRCHVSPLLGGITGKNGNGHGNNKSNKGLLSWERVVWLPRSCWPVRWARTAPTALGRSREGPELR